MNASMSAAKQPKIKKLEHMTVGKFFVYLILTLWAITTIFPFVWVINNSFKLSEAVINDSFSFSLVRQVKHDRYGQEVYGSVLLDENNRVVYDKWLLDDQGNQVYEEDTGLPAFDKVNGKIVYDTENSSLVVLMPTLDNYINAFTNPRVNILRGYRNSIIISGTVTIAVMLLSTMLAFGMTRYRFRGRGIISVMVSGALMFPAFATIIPVYNMIYKLGLFDTLGGVIIPQTAGNLAFATVVMTGFVASSPYELEEAAFMEGCNVFQIFFRIVLPLSKPALATVSIFTFLWSYNDLFMQIVLLRSANNLPVCAILREISSIFGTDFGLMAAAVTIVVMPVVIVYIFLQKNIIKGLTAGAVKG